MDIQEDAAQEEKRMIILHIASINFDPFSGVCVVMPQYLLEQEKLGHQVALYNSKDSKTDAPVYQIPHMDNFDIEKMPEPFNRPDLVVFQECYRKEHLGVGKQLEKKGIPYIIIPHGELRKEAQKEKRLKKAAANLLLFNRFTDKALALQCLSKEEYDATDFGKKKFIATNGVAMPQKRKTEFSETGLKMLYIGRLDAHVKGLDILLEAVRKCLDLLKSNSVTLDIYGPDYAGRYAHMEELISSLGVGEVVTLHHEIVGEDKVNKLLESDIFVQTSRHEGMPGGILEALSYGLPCLVSRGTNLGEKIRDNGCGWMAENDADSVAESIRRVIEERDTLGDKSVKASAFVADNYSWNVIMKETIASYQKLLEENNASGPQK